jgi:hypothetical protein
MPSIGAPLLQDALLKYNESEWEQLAVSPSAPYFVLEFEIDFSSLLQELHELHELKDSDEDTKSSGTDRSKTLILWRVANVIHWEFIDQCEFSFIRHILSGRNLSEYLSRLTEQEIDSHLQLFLKFSEKSIFRLAN